MPYLVFDKSFEDTIMDPGVTVVGVSWEDKGAPPLASAVLRRHWGQSPASFQWSQSHSKHRCLVYTVLRIVYIVLRCRGAVGYSAGPHAVGDLLDLGIGATGESRNIVCPGFQSGSRR